MAEWFPNPDCNYLHNYEKIFADIRQGILPKDKTYRTLILEDLYFILQFVMAIPGDIEGHPFCNSPFVVNACREIQEGPQDFTLDVWAREHFKSTIITIGETTQYALKYPEHSQAIFSYASPVAKKFLFSIKEMFETKKILKAVFPEIVWMNPKIEAPIWSQDGGLILKRKTTRKEPSISAWGLTEGMPTGLHFERRVYDDISTEDMASSFELMDKVKLKFDSSQNLGTIKGVHRVTGTYYNHEDPLIYIRDKRDLTVLNEQEAGQDLNPDDVHEILQSAPSMYHYRKKPATHDGTALGNPVFLPIKRLNALKNTLTFNCQQLLDPTPQADQTLNPDFLIPIEAKDIPRDCYTLMLIDQAGDESSNKKGPGKGDSWAMGVVGVEPEIDSIGQSNIFIKDLWVSPADESEAIEQAIRMYLKAGIVDKLGVEKVGISTTHRHIAEALKAKGRYVEFGEVNESKVGILLRPAGRNKVKFIESAISWPLNNGKIHYSKAIPTPYVERLKQEMFRFSAWQDDTLNMLAYTYDVLKNGIFVANRREFNRPLKLVKIAI